MDEKYIRKKNNTEISKKEFLRRFDFTARSLQKLYYIILYESYYNFLEMMFSIKNLYFVLFFNLVKIFVVAVLYQRKGKV